MPDIYSIAMQLNLDDKASEGLRGVTEGLTKLVEQLDLARHGFAGLQSAVAAGAGIALVAGLMKISGAANELTKSLNQMRMAGLDAQRAMDAVNLVIAARPGLSREDVLANLKTLLPQLGPAAYTSILPMMQQQEAFRFAGVQNGLLPAIQAARERGITDPAAIQQFVENYLRISQSTMGQVTPEMLLNLQRRAGAGGMQWSPEFMQVGLPAFLMSGAGLGGRQNLGMALERLDQAMLGQGGMGGRGGLGGVINRRAFASATGRQLTAQDEQMMAQDPARWARTVGSQLEAAYGEGHMADVIKRLFTNPVVQQAMLFWMTTVGAQAMERQWLAFRQTLGSTPAGMAIIDRDPSTMLESVRNRWKNLMDQIALANQPEYLRQLTWIDHLVEQMQNLQRTAGPEGTNLFMEGLKGIGGAVAAFFAVVPLWMLAALVPGGQFALAMAGIALGITALIALNYDAVAKGLDTLWRAIRNFLSAIGLIGWESQQGPMGNAPAWTQGAKGMMYRRLGELPFAGGFDYVDRNFPAQSELGAHGQAIVPPSQVPGWLPQFMPQGDPHKGKDVNVSVDLNLDGRLIGNVLISKVLDDYEFSHGPATFNPNTSWPDGGYTSQSR